MTGELDQDAIESRKVQDGGDVLTITIPKHEVAEPLGIEPGDSVLFVGEAGSDRVTLSKKSLESLRTAGD